MKKKLMIVVGIIFIIVISIVIIFALKNNGSKQIEITVMTNGWVPYKWEYEIKDENIVKYVKDYVIYQDENVDGGIVQKNFVFEGLKQGETVVKLKYVSIIDETVEKEETYNLRVDRSKNISLQVVK